MNVRKLGFLVLLLMVIPLAARADFQAGSIGPSTCSSCLGGTYTLNFIGNNAGNTFTVVLTITTPTTGVVAGEYINRVNVGFGSQVTNSPTVVSSTGASWTTVLGNLNSSSGNCDGPPPTNKICSQQGSGTPTSQFAVANGSTYTWTWTVTLNKTGNQLLAANTQFHIGAQYIKGPTSEGHIVSEEVIAPEPTTAAGLGIGLFLLAFKLRRNR